VVAPWRPDPEPAGQVQGDALRRLVDEALQIAQEEAHLWAEIRSALEQGDDRAAVALMRRHLGLPPAKVLP